MLSRLKHKVKKIFQKPPESKLVPRAEHLISRKNISRHALHILYRLKDAGYDAYLVGGCVRDLLLEHVPKDFDVVTNARPEMVKKLFERSLVIGRRFKLVHVYQGRDYIEVSTFRSGQPVFHEGESNRAMIKQDNQYGELNEDVWRRDFTVNALYYNIRDFSVVDYVDGVQDLKTKILRIIGDPVTRFHEDPIRMLRAIRFAAKLNFTIEHNTEQAIFTYKSLLLQVAPARLFDEVIKLLFTGHALASYRELCRTQYFEVIFPKTFAALSNPNGDLYQKLIEQAMQVTDERYANDQTLNPGFLLAVLLWPALQEKLSYFMKHKYRRLFEALHHGIEKVMRETVEHINIPRRFTTMMRDIWMLQYHMSNQRKKRVGRVLDHRYFRAAIDFLELRALVGEPVGEMAKWWRAFAAADPEERSRMLQRL